MEKETIESLERLFNLKERGAIDDAEYARLKDELLVPKESSYSASAAAESALNNKSQEDLAEDVNQSGSKEQQKISDSTQLSAELSNAVQIGQEKLSKVTSVKCPNCGTLESLESDDFSWTCEKCELDWWLAKCKKCEFVQIVGLKIDAEHHCPKCDASLWKQVGKLSFVKFSELSDGMPFDASAWTKYLQQQSAVSSKSDVDISVKSSRRKFSIKGPNWRKTTWVILVWNILMLVWIVGGVSSAGNPTDCQNLSQQLCNDAFNVGKGIGAAVIVSLWLVGDFLLIIIWFVTNRQRRVCPSCGRNAKVGELVCKSCGHIFSR